MANQLHGHEIAELSAAVTTALMLICNRLIEHGALDREEIKADLAAEVESIREQEPSVLKEMILSGLAFALHSEPSPQSEARPAPQPYQPKPERAAADLTEIDNLDSSLRLIGRDE